jgi:hypothetical protein
VGAEGFEVGAVVVGQDRPQRVSRAAEQVGGVTNALAPIRRQLGGDIGA